jgi:hypothetical protein
MSLYDTVRATVDKSGGEERVEVNQRALIDKILARYASAGAVYRELLQNSNDADATVAELYYTTASSASTGSDETTTNASSSPLTSKKIVTSVQYRNNGLPFRPQDWARLKKIAEGNPDESKIGAFGVGAYTMFSICEEPMVLSGNQALAFVWKGDSLWTKTVDNDNGNKHKGWTSFILPSRDPYPLPNLQEFGEFLCASLTFTKSLREIRLFVNDKQRMTITKTQIQEPTVVQIQKSSSWWKSDGAVTASPSGLFSLVDENALLESFYHVQVTLDGETAAVTARYLSAVAKTKVPAQMSKRMERVTKKKPPSKVEVQIFLNGQQQIEEKNKRSKAYKIIQSFSPRIGEGRIFIGFRTSQTTGLAAHLSAPFVPTVEREAMDLQDQTLRMFNTELLEFSGILMRLTLEHGMSALGVEYAKGAVERAKLDQKLLKQDETKQQQPASVEQENDKTVERADSTEDDGASKSSVWGFAKFMAKGVKKTLVNVVSKVEEMVDDGGELMHPKDPRPLCAQEHQAILLMQSFCPRQSTPDPMVGTALAQGFSRCMPDNAPPVLTRSGVVPGDQARLPNKGMEAFCKDGVVRSIVYQNAEEYHNVIAQCRTLSLDDLSNKLAEDVLEEAQLIRFLKWWVRFGKIQQISISRGLDIKERIRFFMNYKEDGDTLPIFMLKDFLFYLDKDKIRTGSSFTVDALPMPDSILPKMIHDAVSLRTLTDSSLREWFSPLPIEIWIDFISHHNCIISGQPEDEKLRLEVLSTLSQEYSKRPQAEQPIFGNFCQNVMKERRCIPFDSSEPTAYSADIPSNLYLYSAQLEAFDGIGNFHKVSQSLKHMGISDDFLVALGVRKSVAIEFLFGNLDTLKWSSDPKPLVEYLRAATLTKQDVNKLKGTQYLPAENDVSRMFAPSELYLPDRDLRVFPFLRLLQWPSEDEVTEGSQNGKFLIGLGMHVLPLLTQILKYVSDQVDDETMRIKCLTFVTQRLGSGGSYQAEYSRIGRAEKAKLKFLPCVVTSPLDGKQVKGLYSVLTCCSEERCAVMGFPVIDPSLGDTAKLFGNLFHCVPEPEPGALIQQLLLLVAAAKRSLKESQGAHRKVLSEKVVEAFSGIFQYLSSRTSEIGSSVMGGLETQDFIPCLVDDEVAWFRPDTIFFEGSKEAGEDSITESLFQVVEFSPFLAGAGVKREASTKDIFRLMIESPQQVLGALKSEEKYKMFLRRVAAHRPFRRATAEIRDSPFLLAYSISGEDSKEAANFELARAQDMYIIDNSFFGRMFPVKRAPHESDLEDFYALIGTKYISKEVNKKYDIVGVAQKNTSLTKALLDRIHERSPLLVSPSVTSRPLAANAAVVLDEKNLKVYEVPDLKAVYSLNKSVRSQRTTCCAQQGSFNKNSLFVTADFDWFDVGYAIGELILERCQLEDAFFISSLLEAPLEQLRSRGFPVDRIIKPEPIPEPEPKVPPTPEVPPTTASDDSDKPSRTSATTQAVSPPPVSAPIIAALPDESSDPQKAGTSVGGSNRENQSKASDANENATEPPLSRDGYVDMLKQMYPGADEKYIRDRLGDKPTLDDVHSLAEEMATGGYPEDPASRESMKSNGSEQKETSKLLGSKKLGKKLGRALNGLRGSKFGGSIGANLFSQPQSVSAPATGSQPFGDGITPVPPETDATSHENMERMLQQTVQQSSIVDSNGISSPETQMSIPEGLDRGSSCEVIPGVDLKPFMGTNQKGESHNGIKIFSARKHPSSEEFIRDHSDAIESFAVVLERLCGVYDLALSSIAIFHDPTGGTIAFNANKALHFNVRFFYALQYIKNMHQSRACYAYWFVTFAHELAHHMASGHNKEHGFYTESYISLYLPKFLVLLAQIE